MVRSGLVDVPRVSHYRLAAHLLLAFAVGAYVLRALVHAGGMGFLRAAGAPPSGQSRLFFALVVVQIAYGAFTAGLRAGQLYNTYPLMGTALWPDGMLGLEPIALNFVENPVTVQFVHRWLALIVLAWALWQAMRPGWASRAALLAALTSVQFGLGIWTLLWAVPVWLGVAHQLGALVVFLAAWLACLGPAPRAERATQETAAR
jgi:cytochrome c oxidase assembly protein subunit 15